MVITAFVLVTIASLLALEVEQGNPQAKILTGEDAFWWTLTTVTTVGYGDYVPVTFPGRIIATVLMTFGISLFAVLTSFVARRIVRLRDGMLPDREEVAAIVSKETAGIRRELAKIKELLRQQQNHDD